MDAINLKALVPVIHACRKAGVRVFKCGEIEINFDDIPAKEFIHVNLPASPDLVKPEQTQASPRFDMEELALTDPSAWAAYDLEEQA
jgi:hypothetical protein